MNRWRVYYDDGSVFDNFTPRLVGMVHEPMFAPGSGVIAIVQDDDAPGDVYAVGRELLFDADYYCWRMEENRWFKCDIRGLFDYLDSPGWKKVLAGRTAPRSVYRSVLIQAINDPNFKVRSAVQANEARLKELTE